MPFDEYLAVDAASNSRLGYFVGKTPAYAKDRIDNPKPPTDDMRLGTLVHAMLLEPDAVNDRFVAAPKVDRRTKIGKAKWAEFEKNSNGREVYTEVVWEKACKMAKNLLEARGPVGGKTEVSAFWIDPQTEEPCKARFDEVFEDCDVIYDHKKTKSAEIGSVIRSIIDYGYARQDAMYSEGYRIITGRPLKEFRFYFVESADLYEVAPYNIDPDSVMKATIQYHSLLQLYSFCKKEDMWPTYSATPRTVTLPDRAFK